MRLLDGAKANQLKTTGYAPRAPYKPTSVPNPTLTLPNQRLPTTGSSNEGGTPIVATQRPRPGVTCFSCGKPGHYAVDCELSKDQQKETLKALGCAPNQIEAYFQGLEALNRMTVGSLVDGINTARNKQEAKPGQEPATLDHSTPLLSHSQPKSSLTPKSHLLKTDPVRKPTDENVCIVSANQDTKGVTVKLGTTIIQQFLNPTSDVTMIRKDVFLEHAHGAQASVLSSKGETFPLGQKLLHSGFSLEISHCVLRHVI